MGKRYSLGVDFGSLSVRAVLFDISNGEYICCEEAAYEHGIIEDVHPVTGEPLPYLTALQIPEDFIKGLEQSVKGVVQKAGIDSEEIVAMSVDATSCSLIPLDRNYQPLCLQKEFKASRHSYIKMWKQHTAAKEAEEITGKAGEEGERFGGRIFSEWAIPKILETLREDPKVYEAAYRFMETGDWIVRILTGEESMSRCSAGFKFMWKPDVGYPKKEFFAKLDQGLENLEEKLIPYDRVLPLDACAGFVSEEGARLTGLRVGTPVAPMRIDAHSSVVGVGGHEPGIMVMIAGTGMGMILQGREEHAFPGLNGVCYGSVVPDCFGYESGLSSCGDLFQWFADQCVPASYIREAGERGMTVLGYLTERLKRYRPGETGLLALDWWNGNRSILVDDALSGVILGLTLQTKPEEILRALFEATGFSAKLIIDEHKKNGVEVNGLIAVGGIAEKNPVLIQIYADIMGCPIAVPKVKQACALGSAIYGAVAAGRERGGYDTLEEAIENMACKEAEHYLPDKKNHEIYEKLFEEYRILHDYFGRGDNDVLKRLMAVKESLAISK